MLLGAGLPLTLIACAGPVAIVQAAVVSLVTFGVIYFSAVWLGLDRRLAATLGTGGPVCGVSGAIAVGAFTLMKVIGRDVWIGVWAFVLSLIATTLWERTEVHGKADAREIRRRCRRFAPGHFTFAFLSIGLTTKLREFAAVGARPFYDFSIGVVVNVELGFVLSTEVFSEFWNRLGT